MHPELTIRAARETDSAALARFLVELHYFGALEGVSVAEAEPRVTRQVAACLADDSHTLLLAEAEGQIVGYSAVHWLPCLYMPGPEGFISELFISEAARGRGIGSALLERVKAEARQRGCARLELINIKARDSYQRGFYRKQGWEERPEAANFVYRL